ncbi:MAG: alpha/beta hydrolase [Alphaproteobacteria bacterium]|nr:alpha/beta hydrolase [Alphaproteobacteria bacterium]
MRRLLAQRVLPGLLPRLLLPLLLLPLGSACSLSRTATRVVEHRVQSQGLEHRRAVFGGRQVSYWIGGEGPPLLLLHGFGGNGLWTWNKQLHDLSRHRTLIVPDLVWFGDSSALGVEPGLDVQVETMIDLLDHEGIERADVMGISYGGFVTLLLHQHHPDRTGKVIVVDSPGPVFDEADRDAMLERLGVGDPADFFVPTDAEGVGRLLAIVRPGGPRIPRGLLEDIRRAWFRGDLDARRALLTELIGLQDAFPPDRWQVPDDLLLVWGDSDPVFPLTEGQQLAAAMDAELVVIEDAAHGPNFQRPRQFNDAVLAFLTREEGPTRDQRAQETP